MQHAHIDNWEEISRHRGFSLAFIEQARAAIEKAKKANASAVAVEIRRAGMMKFRHQGMPEWARSIVLDVSDRTGVCISDIVRDARLQRIGKARNEAMYLIKAHKPTLSCVLMAKWFNRDHTTVLHGIASHQELHGLPKIVGYELDRARARNRAWWTKSRQVS